MEPYLPYIPVDPDQLYATVEEKHQQQDMELKQNQAYAVASTNIPVEPNQCYIPTTPSVDPDQLYATQDMELKQNQAYAVASTNIPVEPNQCYIPTTPLVDPDQLYMPQFGGNASSKVLRSQKT